MHKQKTAEINACKKSINAYSSTNIEKKTRSICIRIIDDLSVFKTNSTKVQKVNGESLWRQKEEN